MSDEPTGLSGGCGVAIAGLGLIGLGVLTTAIGAYRALNYDSTSWGMLLTLGGMAMVVLGIVVAFVGGVAAQATEQRKAKKGVDDASTFE